MPDPEHETVSLVEVPPPGPMERLIVEKAVAVSFPGFVRSQFAISVYGSERERDPTPVP